MNPLDVRLLLFTTLKVLNKSQERDKQADSHTDCRTSDL